MWAAFSNVEMRSHYIYFFLTTHKLCWKVRLWRRSYYNIYYLLGYVLCEQLHIYLHFERRWLETMSVCMCVCISLYIDHSNGLFVCADVDFAWEARITNATILDRWLVNTSWRESFRCWSRWKYEVCHYADVICTDVEIGDWKSMQIADMDVVK
jgi:hypothetical protein